jgi:uncharacterized HAD superfamily protein
MIKISFDLDGVLYPFHDIVYDYVRRIYGEGTDLDPYSFWEWFNIRSELWQSNIIRTLDIYDKAIPSKELLNRLELLSKHLEIFYITSRPLELQFVTRSYLDRYKFPHSYNLFFSDDKSIPVIENDIDIHVEDRIKHIDEVLPFCKVLLISQPWNRDYQGDVPRYNNIIECLDDLLWSVESV